MTRPQLARLLGPGTTVLLGLGVAVGSGILRTPGSIADTLRTPSAILLVWLAGGFFILATSLVSAELASRFPEAGGEYVYLKAAYGEPVAFFFGHGYTFFIVGGGVATIGAAAGEAVTLLLGIDISWSRLAGVVVIGLVTLLNCVGLQFGAVLQNALTVTKLGLLLLIAFLALFFGQQTLDLRVTSDIKSTDLIVNGFLPALWAYEGTTDSIKMAEEMRDVRRLPRALITSALAITALYLVLNVSFLRLLPFDELAGSTFIVGDVLARTLGEGGRPWAVALSLVVFLAALSATMLATVRVTFALARDGLTFRRLATMSSRQSPGAALAFVAAIAMVFVSMRDFSEIIGIYFLAAAVLFGMTYASLIVFRVRDRGRAPDGVFRCPGGVILAAVLVLFEAALGFHIVRSNPRDGWGTLLLLVGLAIGYLAWRRLNPAHPDALD